MQKKNDEFYDELLAKTDLVKLISEYVPLEKRGAAFWGRCPFHHEKTASFSVSDEKQMYHCFGCGEGGNAFSFVKKIESVDFADAVRILAKRAGMEIPRTERTSRFGDAEILKKKERLYALMREAARHYHENLSAPGASLAREYLKSRGVDEQTATKFGLGYSLNGTEMIAYLDAKGYTQTEMKDAGLTGASEKGVYDVFYDRLMFPIINQLGEVVAFGGRTLQKNPDFAKYRNSSQTLIFDKSRTIYAVNLLQKRKQRKNIEYVILCEGYMDVIALHSAGFDTAAASMGTALTFTQAKLLRNFASRIYISYDGDTAGQKATMRGLDILDEAGLSVRVVKMPDGMDPDDAVRKNGADFYQALLSSAVALPAFKIETLQKQYDLTDSEGKAKYAVEAAKVIKALKNPVEQEEYLHIIRLATGYSMEALRRQTELAVPALEVRAPAPQAEVASVAERKEESARKFVLASIAACRDYVDFSADFHEFLTDTFARETALFFVANRRDKKESVASLFYQLGDEAEKELNEIIHYPFIDGDNAQKYAACVHTLREIAVMREKERLVAAWKTEQDGNRRKEILLKLSEIEEKLKQLKNGGESE